MQLITQFLKQFIYLVSRILFIQQVFIEYLCKSV